MSDICVATSAPQRVLLVKSSASANSQSSTLGERVIERMKTAKDLRVVVRDLGKNPPKFVTQVGCFLRARTESLRN